MAVKRPKAKAHTKAKHVKRPDRELKRLANATKRAKIPQKPSEGPLVVSSRTEPAVIPKAVPQASPQIPVELPAEEAQEDVPEVSQEAAEEELRDEPPRQGRSFVIGDAVEFAWKSVKSRLWFFLGVMVLLTILSLIAGQVTGAGSKIVLGLLVVGLHAGFARLALDVVEGKKAEFKELFSCFAILHWFIIGAILYWLIVGAGLVLLIVPGIIWLLAFSQWLFVLVDSKKNSIACLRRSVALTDGVKGQLIIFWLALFGINILGSIPAGLGLLVTIPLSIIASAHVYDQLRKSA